MNPFEVFDCTAAIEINKARQDHLASLGLDLMNKSVLEVGSGVGWHTAFFEKLGCTILSTDARKENVQEHLRRYPYRRVEVADLSIPGSHERFGEFDIIYCYGTLYHLQDPVLCLTDLSKICKELFLLETIVYPEDNGELNLVEEDKNIKNQSFSGTGCRPSRNWLLNELGKYFPYVYLSVTQPDHPDFPLVWPARKDRNDRAIFVASRKELNLNTLIEELIYQQEPFIEAKSKNIDSNLEGILFDDFRVFIDPRATKIGGSWQGPIKDGLPTAWDMKTIKFFYHKTLEFEQPVILDIGANTGSFSLLARINQNIKGYAFEPVPETYNILNSNLQLNNLQDRIKTFQIALSNKKGKAILKYPKSGIASGMACIGNPLRFNDWIEIEVPMSTLDEIAITNHIKHVDLIKIDTEGCELFVLKGAEKLIKENYPDILIEYYAQNTRQFGYEPEEILNLLYSWGYEDSFDVGTEDRYFYKRKKKLYTSEITEIVTHETNSIKDKFHNWIKIIAKLENRLYYRDQTTESLYTLVEFVYKYRPDRIVELGTLSGLSLRTWLEADKNLKITAIDLSFRALHQTYNLIPFDRSRITLIEQNILTVDFSKLWNDEEKVLLYVDAHDLPDVPIMEYILNNALPGLSKESIIVVDDLWYSPERLTDKNVRKYFEEVIINEIDSLQCFKGYFADYWKGGSFFGFLEVIPLMKWVNSNKIELDFKPGIKSVSFRCPSKLPGYTSIEGKIAYNPLEGFTGERELSVNQSALALCNKGIKLYELGNIMESLECFQETLKITSDISGIFYAIAVCIARLGNLEEASRLLEYELNRPRSHPNAGVLLEDIQIRLGKKSVTQKSQVMDTFTIFTVPKAFHGHIDIIQRNAIQSWTLLEPRPEIILIGDDDGVSQIAKEFGLKHIADVKRNEFGTPLLDSIFDRAISAASNKIMMYINTDIILTGDIMSTVRKVREKIDTFLIIGQRWDLDLTELISFDNKHWEKTLYKHIEESGNLHGPAGLDYFIFSGNPWGNILPFALGRTCWDGWLIFKALSSNTPVIDATEAITAIHQNHDYSHVRDGKEGAWKGPEAKNNVSLLGGYGNVRTVFDATWRFQDNCLTTSPYSFTRIDDSNLYDRLYKQGLHLLKEKKFNQVLSTIGLLDYKNRSDFAELLACACNGKGEERFRKGHMESALNSFIKAIQIDPENVVSYNNLGGICRHKGQTKKALEYFIKALKIDATNRTTVLNTGNILIELEKYEEAEKLYLSYLEKNPSDREITNALTNIKNKIKADNGSVKSNQLSWKDISHYPLIRLYAGDIPDMPQYEGLTGLSIEKNDSRHIRHDITGTFPLPDNSVYSFQAEDVFEHIEYEKLPDVINEIHRILKPGGLFRLSVPDYGCDILRDRSVKNEKGEIIFDPGGGGTIDNPGHLWYPTIENVKNLLEKTKFAESGELEYLHYYNMDGTFTVKEIDYSKGYVHRTPDYDERVKNPYRPMSIVIDATKSYSDVIKVLPEYKHLKLLQIHTFYEQVINDIYLSSPGLEKEDFITQIEKILKHGFSGIHMLAPYFTDIGYNSQLIIANCSYAQFQWLKENNQSLDARQNWILDITRKQVDNFKPDILYLTDPITFDSKFIRSLSWKPSLVIGWRAANIPPSTDWSEFDIILSMLTFLRQAALELGAKSTEDFFPGFPEWINKEIEHIKPEFDVVFSGQWTVEQHSKRNFYLTEVAKAATEKGFSCGFFLSGQVDTITPDVAKYNFGGRFGIDMHKVLRKGKICLDARAQHRLGNIDIGGKDTANMRIFETTGSGVFLLTQYHENLERFFVIGKEIETFRDEKELIEKICYYLRHESEREEIARRGQIRCLQDYSMSKRVLEFDRIIQKYLLIKSRKDSSVEQGIMARTCKEKTEVALEMPDMVINEAIEKLNIHNNTEALHLFEKAITLKPDMPGLNYGKALALARLGQRDKAIEILKDLLNNIPGHRKAKILLDDLISGSTINEQIPENHGINKIAVLMDRALKALQENSYNVAFNLLIEAKALKQPEQDLDYLRGICFLKMNRLDEGREALQEELRYFPDNIKARDLLNRVLTQYPQFISGKIGDEEFQKLIKIIRPYTMLSEERLFSLFTLAKKVCLENIPGNFVECGVAAGGSSALLAYVIKRYSRQTRFHYAFDSFEGMPEPSAMDKHDGIDADATGWGTGTCAAGEDSVKEICAKLGVLDVIKTVKGYFEDTLPETSNTAGMISFLHMDGDWYSSTKAILDNLYQHISNGGFIQVDDYGYWEGCKKAIHEFEVSRNLKFNINQIDGTGVWFQKPDKFPLNKDVAHEIVSEFNEDDPACIGIESQMSPNERFQLYYAIRNLLPCRTSRLYFVEVGSYAGASLVLIWRAFKRLRSNIHGFTVEPGGTSQFYEVIKQLGNEITHFHSFSHQAVAQLKQIFEQDNSYPELIFIDGDHTYEGVKQDIINYYPLLAPGGIMVFHDYLPTLNDENREAIFTHHAGQEPGIRRACQELMEDTYHCEIIDIPLLYPSDPVQTQPHLPIIPGVFSTIRVYKKNDVTVLSSAEANIKQNKKHKRRKHK